MGQSKPAPTPHGLLTRHFLRQFLENDLISPDADRSQLVAVVGATVVCLTLFVSIALSFNYVMMPFTPGQLAVLSLDDKFLYLALAMIVTALAAVAQWDGLAVGTRDAAILEPLPIRAGAIRRAKLAAVAIFGAAVAAAVTILPSIVFPWLLVYSLRQMSLLTLLALIAAHALVAAAAAAFGFLAIVAVREVLAALTGRWFPRVSPPAQGALIVLVGAALLLLPALGGRIAQRGFEGWRAQAPPMWFLGAHEMMAGRMIADQPRGPMSPRQRERDRLTSELYASRRHAFPALATRAAIGFGVILIAGIAAYAWNARRLPSLTPAPPRAARRRWRVGTRLAHALFLRDAAARAGFHLTLAALWRNHTHRLTLACAAAAGLAMAVVAISRADLEAGASPRILAVQPLVYGALLVGFRHAIRVPAELRASWGFQLAWRGQERAFLSGVRRAAILALTVPMLLALLPLYVFVLGPQQALVHAVLGLAGAIVLLEALMVTYDKAPFTCTYVPSENMKALGPVYGIAFLVGATQFARLQHDALQNGRVIVLLVTLAAIFGILRMMAARRARLPSIEFNEAPASFQRLGLDT